MTNFHWFLNKDQSTLGREKDVSKLQANNEWGMQGVKLKSV